MPTAKKVTPVKKTTVKKPIVVVKKVEPVVKIGGLSVELYALTGKKSGAFALPKEFFGGKINNPLMAQAVRIYLANQKQGTVSTKTRGEVEGSSRKIYNQKGTGRARHGSIRANIFVKGGIAFGPKPRDLSLNFPKKMKKAALISALSAKAKAGEIKVLSGFDKIEPKTKIMAKVLKAINPKSVKTLLVISSPKETESLYRASRNIENLQILQANLLNTYEVLDNVQVLFMEEAIDSMSKEKVKETK